MIIVNNKVVEANGTFAVTYQCRVGEGPPTSMTVGTVGSLYMDGKMGGLYKCTLVQEFEQRTEYEWTRLAEVRIGEGAPGSWIVGEVGDLYMDSTSCDLYICSRVDVVSEIESRYIWIKVGGSGSDEYAVSSGVGAPTESNPGADGDLYLDITSGSWYVCRGVSGGSEETGNLYAWDKVNTEGSGSAEGAVLYTEQNLTDEQKALARKNIGAMSEESLVIKSAGAMGSKVNISADPVLNDAGDDVLSAVVEFYEIHHDGKCVLRNIGDGVLDSDAATVGQLNTAVGDISSALDSIIALQEELIGT